MINLKKKLERDWFKSDRWGGEQVLKRRKGYWSRDYRYKYWLTHLWQPANELLKVKHNLSIMQYVSFNKTICCNGRFF